MTLASYSKSRPTKRGGLLLFALIASLIAVALMDVLPSSAAGEATVTTDKHKYYLGETMQISGGGFTSNGSIVLTVQRPDKVVDTVPNVTASAGGTFTASYTPQPAVGGRFRITATDGINSANTAATEADALKSDFLQCSNENNVLGTCKWIGSILQNNNSKYFEGMSTLQHLVLDEIPPTTGSPNTHTLTFRTDATKGGNHAYDYLTTWESAIAAAQAIDPLEALFPDLTLTPAGNNNACRNPSNPQPSLEAVCLTLRAGANVYSVDRPTMTNANVAGNVDASANAYGARFGADGLNAMRMYGNSLITSATLTFVGYTGSNDQEALYTLTWASNSTSLLIEFGAHIAMGQDVLGGNIGYGAGLGASDINGGPYHVSIAPPDGLDGSSIGSLDNQLQGSDILVPPETPVVTTQVHNAAHADITNTSIPLGSTVHDWASLAATPNNGIPTGTVTFQFFTNSGCTGTAAATSAALALVAGVVDATTFPQGPLAGGQYGFKASFTSNASSKWNNAVGVCEPFTVINPATTLTTKSVTPAPITVGQTVTVVVTETNSGTDTLTNVNVTGGGSCASFAPASVATLAAGASQDFTCTFTAVAGANAWFADGHGTDSLGSPAPTTGEHTSGSVTGLVPATTLVMKSVTAAPITVGQTVTVVVTETNSGGVALHAVSVTGGGSCITGFTGGATTLAVGASTDFTCTFTAVAGANPWTADGQGLDPLNNPVPSTGEHAEGSVTGLVPATTLVMKSVTAAPITVGQTVTVVVTETNSGGVALHAVSVTGGGSCITGFTGGATTLAVGASTDFTCTFTAVAGANPWTADGQGLDPLNNPVPSTGEHAEGSVTGLVPATTLVMKSVTAAPITVGQTVTVVVTETNSGGVALHAVSVTGGGSCITGFTGGATTLAVGASTDFTCTFTAVAGANPWTADGQGLDPLNNPVPSTGEHAEGSVTGLVPATTLVMKSVTAAPITVGQTVTVVVTETNSGGVALHAVSVTGGGSCITGFTGGATTLAVGASTDFTCTFTAVAGANPWTADGQGLDPLNNPVPSTGEHAEGSVTGLVPATTLVMKSVTAAPITVGQTVTVVVTETNSGGVALHAVSVTGGGSCITGFTGGATTLAVGASTDFTCTFTAVAGANPWTADGQGLDPLNNPVPSTGEHAEGSVTGLVPATTLVMKSVTAAPITVGQTVTVVVTETNSGGVALHAVSVTGGGSCITGFTGGATTLAVGASTDFTCTFTAVAGANPWTADGQGLDPLNNPVPSTGEHAEGSVTGLVPATTLVMESVTPAPITVGQTVTVVVTETNSGGVALHAVSVTGGGSCITGFTGGATTLAVGASTDFTCTFTAVAGANPWTADGQGLDPLNNPVPSTGEHAEGSVTGLVPATTLVMKSVTAAPITVGQTVTVVVTETNSGGVALHAVSVTGGGSCITGFTGGATTLAVGASTDFTCTFTAVAGANPWTADGQGLDPLNNPVPSTGEHAEGSVTGLKVPLTINTNVHNTAHADVTNKAIPVGSVVHDTATVTGTVGGHPLPAITFTFFTNGACTGDGTGAGLGIEAGFAARSDDSAALGVGSYSYRAAIAGDEYYIGDDAPCEPFSVNDVKVLKTESVGGTPVTLATAYTFCLYGGTVQPASATVGGALSCQTTPPGTLDFGPRAAGTFTMCEMAVPAGTHSTLADLLGATEDSTTGNVCITFTLGAGEQKTFEVNNNRPGGDTRTIGYWKNWNSCSHIKDVGGVGPFVARAAKTGNHLADEFLAQVVPFGILTSLDCPTAVHILSKEDTSGKNQGSDAAYSLAAQLLAAKLNIAAGAGTCLTANNAIADGDKLLGSTGGTLSDGFVVAPADAAKFNDTGSYWKGGKNATALRAEALKVAAILDNYNNNGC